MKKRWVITLLATLAFAGCSKSEPEKKNEITVPVPTITLPGHDAGSTSATFTATSSWTLSLSDTRAVPAWFTVDKTSGGAGTHTLAITIAEANPSATQVRTGYIKIVSGNATQTITLIQPKAAVIAVTGVSLNKGETFIVVNGKESLVAIVNPANATNKNVTWSSSDQRVVTVNPAGEITGVKTGSATITVTAVDGNKTASCTVSVLATAVSVTGISLNKAATTIELGRSETLTATLNPTNATNQNVTWSSSDQNIATVSGGVVTTHKAGTATITVTTADGNKTASCTVTILPGEVPLPPVTGVSLNKTATSLLVSGTETLTATVSPANASNRSVTWSSSDPRIATVSSLGEITGVKAGTATITVTTVDGNKTATCSVTILPGVGGIPVTGVTLDKTTATSFLNNTATLVATIAPSNATNKNVTWSSSDETIVSVGGTGVMKGLKVGVATITVTTTDGGKKATCVITVIDAVNAGGVMVDSWGYTIDLGGGDARKE